MPADPHSVLMFCYKKPDWYKLENQCKLVSDQQVQTRNITRISCPPVLCISYYQTYRHMWFFIRSYSSDWMGENVTLLLSGNCRLSYAALCSVHNAIHYYTTLPTKPKHSMCHSFLFFSFMLIKNIPSFTNQISVEELNFLFPSIIHHSSPDLPECSALIEG